MGYGRRGGVSTAQYNEALQRENAFRKEVVKLKEELAQAKDELEIERRRYAVCIPPSNPAGALGESLGKDVEDAGAIVWRRGATIAAPIHLRLKLALHMLDELACMVPHLEESKATKSVARRMRAILGPHAPEEVGRGRQGGAR